MSAPAKVCSDVESLAERCEKATGPDRELDCLIAKALGLVDQRTQAAPQGFGYVDRNQWAVVRVERYTVSLDAAMTLVPEGCGINLERYWTRQREEWAVILTCGLAGRGVRVEAATGPLALCAAALRAQAQGIG